MKYGDESREAVARLIFEEIDAPLFDPAKSWRKAAVWDRHDLTCLPAAELRNRCLAAVDRLRAAGIIVEGGNAELLFRAYGCSLDGRVLDYARVAEEKQRPAILAGRRWFNSTPVLPLVLLLALALGGCAAVGGALMFTGMTISCGPMPISPDQCGGGWVKTLFKPDNAPEEKRP